MNALSKQKPYDLKPGWEQTTLKDIEATFPKINLDNRDDLDTALAHFTMHPTMTPNSFPFPYLIGSIMSLKMAESFDRDGQGFPIEGMEQPNYFILKEARRVAHFYVRFFYHFTNLAPWLSNCEGKKWPSKAERNDSVYSTRAYKVYRFLAQQKKLLRMENEDNMWGAIKLVTGDCGMFAITLQQALLANGIEGAVTVNGPNNHATFHYEGYHYDGMGWSSDAHDYLLHPINRRDVSIKEAVYEYLRVDGLGFAFVKGYCKAIHHMEALVGIPDYKDSKEQPYYEEAIVLASQDFPPTLGEE